MLIRPIVEADRDWLLERVTRRPYPSTLGVSAEQRRASLLADYQQYWQQLQTPPDYSWWAGPEQSFWLLAHNQVDSLSGDSQAVLMDYVGALEQHRLMLEHARQHLSESAIVVRIYPELPDAGFRQLGFVPELSRVALHPQRQPESELFELRRAGPADKMFLTYLNGQATAAYVPGGREGSQKRIAQRNLETYLALDLGPDSNMVGLILTRQGQEAGYVLLELGQQAEITGQPAAYFYDIVVDPNFHQQGAARALMNACQNWLVDNNWPVLIGDISKNNPVAYHGATKIVGCQLEYERWGLLLRQ